jgi:hypothetical protein
MSAVPVRDATCCGMSADNHRLRIGAMATAQYSGDGDPLCFVEHRPIAAKRPTRRGDRLS